MSISFNIKNRHIRDLLEKEKNRTDIINEALELHYGLDETAILKDKINVAKNKLRELELLAAAMKNNQQSR